MRGLTDSIKSHHPLRLRPAVLLAGAAQGFGERAASRPSCGLRGAGAGFEAWGLSRGLPCAGLSLFLQPRHEPRCFVHICA